MEAVFDQIHNDLDRQQSIIERQSNDNSNNNDNSNDNSNNNKKKNNSSLFTAMGLVCGPSRMVDNVSELCFQHSFDFHTETFEF